MTKPLVSIIVATYNCADLLALTLESIALQDLQDYEVLVIGDGCTDHTGDVVIARNDQRYSWENLPENHRAPHVAHNRGLAKARGNYIAYLNHDDLWFPWHLSGLVEAIEKQSVDFVYDMTATVPSRVQQPYCIGEFVGLKGLRAGIPSCWLHRNPLLEGQLNWRNPYEVGMPTDTDFICRANTLGARFIYLATLGIVKFASTFWNTYKSQTYIQEEYLRQLRQDPHRLRLRLLEVSASNMFYGTTVRHLRGLLRNLQWSLVISYGQDRFPMPSILRAYFLSRRRMANRKRGLPF